jgi:hypothetical protein
MARSWRVRGVGTAAPEGDVGAVAVVVDAVEAADVDVNVEDAADETDVDDGVEVMDMALGFANKASSSAESLDTFDLRCCRRDLVLSRGGGVI